MDTLKQLRDEFNYEYGVTQKFLEIYPPDKNEYKPHEKSYTLQELSNHIVNIFGWPAGIVATSEMDIAPKDGETPVYADSSIKLTTALKNNFDASMAALEKIGEDELTKNWELKAVGKSLMNWDKYGAIRHALNQITHHRAQLGMNYRLLNIELPSSYGPTADQKAVAYN